MEHLVEAVQDQVEWLDTEVAWEVEWEVEWVDTEVAWVVTEVERTVVQ